jgi:hypothetical protein
VTASPAHPKILRLRISSFARLPQPGLRSLSQRLVSVGSRTDHLKTSRYSYRHVSRTLQPRSSPEYCRARPINDQADCYTSYSEPRAPVPHLTTRLQEPHYDHRSRSNTKIRPHDRGCDGFYSDHARKRMTTALASREPPLLYLVDRSRPDAFAQRPAYVLLGISNILSSKGMFRGRALPLPLWSTRNRQDRSPADPSFNRYWPFLPWPVALPAVVNPVAGNNRLQASLRLPLWLGKKEIRHCV